MPVRDRRTAALAAPARPRRRAILVEAPVSSMKTRRSGIEIWLGVEPGLAPRGDVGTILLAGVRGFF